MTVHFVSEGLWTKLRAAARASKNPAHLAVAYVGSNAARLLPVQPQSYVVVDASLAAVEAGSTNPTPLLTLHDRGIHIFSRPLLHAKTFVFDRECFVGSGNASSRSASTLIEAAIRTDEVKAVEDARAFVMDLATDPLERADLVWLKSKFKPPKPGSPVKPADDAAPRLIMQLTDNMGFSGKQVQPPSGVWSSFFRADHSDRGRELHFRDRTTGAKFSRAVVAHTNVLSLDIPGWDRGDLWEVFQVGLDRYEYRIARAGTLAYRQLDKVLRTTPNPEQRHGRLWTVVGTPET